MKDLIKFYTGEENGLVIEDSLNDSIFDSQYRKAQKLFDSIVNQYNEHSPNIIAFCGDRGDGKTSAMLSFVASERVKFHHVLPLIAPSHFDEEHNIIELILGQLYQSSMKGNDEQFEKLMNCFAEVQRCISVLKPGKEQLYDRIAEIHELSASMNLGKRIEDLFSTFIEYKADRDKDKEKKIVIVIDDMDYNWFGAYTMIKMIEKYLRNQHCVIVVSVKIEQLAELVKMGYEREIKGQVNEIDLKKIAQKYINKVIPIYNRIEMPKVRDIVDLELQIWKDRLIDKDSPFTKPEEQFRSVKEGVLKLIFLKTRYLFYNSKGGVSLIVPSDLRSLRQLLGLLMGMPDFKKDSKIQSECDDNSENKRLFKYYFYYTWTQQLSEEDRAFADKLVDNNDTFSINKMVVNYMRSFLDELQKKSFENLLEPSNYSYNITVGDVFNMMDMIERNALDLKQRQILFFVRSFYSITLYELYDDVTKDKKTLTTLYHEMKLEIDLDGPEVFKSDAWFKNTNSLQRFINGSYFSYEPCSLLESLEKSRVGDYYPAYPMDTFCVYGALVNAHFEKLSRKLASYKYIGTPPVDFRRDCLFADYLMICILTSLDREIGVDERWVIKKDFAQPLYLTTFDKDTAYYVFDIMAPFSNLVNLKYTYNRYRNLLPGWYDFVSGQDWTILGRLKEAIKPIEGNHDESGIASDAIIRNAEVLSSVRERALSRHQIVVDRDHYLKYVSDFYESLINSEMRTYPQSREENTAYTIRFQFLSVLSSVLKEIDTPENNRLLTGLIQRAIEGGSAGIS